MCLSMDVRWNSPSYILALNHLFQMVNRALASTCISPPVMASQAMGHTWLSCTLLNLRPPYKYVYVHVHHCYVQHVTFVHLFM
jgi:hypothetical protein